MLDLDLAQGTMAIQGFGHVGQTAARLGSEWLGLRLIAACDSQSGVYNEEGLDAKALIGHKLRTGSLRSYPGAEAIGSAEVLEQKVTVLFPAALENAITADNAGKIQCRLCCEPANGPTTPDADAVLEEKNIFVVPDLLANAGAVIVSYFEQVQNSYNFYWNLEEVHSRLDEIMTQAFHAVYMRARQEKASMRDAAYLVAVARVAEACRMRGWV